MIYKVYYQENITDIPVRENTKTLYLEAASEREVRHYLKDRNYNIELVQLLEGNYLSMNKIARISIWRTLNPYEIRKE